MSNTKARVVLVDGSSLVFRAFFALPSSFSTRDGLPTNATYGFALMFRKLLAGRTPTYGAVIFDAPGPTFRDELYADYKAQRPRMPSDMARQLEWIDEVVRAHDYPILRVRGYEADDVIGTLTHQALEAGHEVRIISADKDFAQLLGPDVRMVDTMRDITYDVELARKKWGVRPEQFIDYLAILGDKSDNIPGVPGIGAKGAATLLDRFGSLAGVYEHIDELKGRQQANLIEFREQAELSRKLATIDTSVPLEVGLADLHLPEVDAVRVNALYRQLEFYSLLDEDPDADIAEDVSYVAATTLDDVRALLEEVGSQPASVLALHELPSVITGDLVGLAVGLAAGKASYVPLRGEGALGDDALALVKGWLEDPARPKIVHDLRDLWTLLTRYGVGIEGVTGDTRLASFLIDPAGQIPHTLDLVVREYLHRTMPDVKTLIGAGKKTQPLAACARDEVAAWACHRAASVVEMWPLIAEGLEAAGQREQLFERDLPLARVLGQMQLDGIRVEADVLGALGAEFSERKDEVEARIYELAGREFNIGSPKQLATVLFEELELPVIKKTKTGYSTAAAVLERLAPKHEIASLILRQRALAKLINTYTAVLRAAVNPATGRVHATFQQTTGVSGRLITTDPDLQRTPIRTDDGKRIREAFVPREGWVLISADWSQIELRILAHFSQDPLLLESFREGIDVHRRTASQIFDVSPEEVTGEQRNVGKTVNFATIYGQGATALGQQLGMTRNEAKGLIKRYFDRYAGVRRWLDATIESARTTGVARTILGRQRIIRELSSNNFNDRAYGERIAANTPIQGTAADLCKLAMLDIAKRLEQSGMKTKMLLQIHDELLFEAPPEEADAACALIREAMEAPYPLEVPLVVDIGVGASWAAAH